MTALTGIDVRLPLGSLFTVLGVLVGGYGLAIAGDRARYAISLGVNVDLWWGAVMLVFGLILLVAARRSRAAPPREPDR